MVKNKGRDKLIKLNILEGKKLQLCLFYSSISSDEISSLSTACCSAFSPHLCSVSPEMGEAWIPHPLQLCGNIKRESRSSLTLHHSWLHFGRNKLIFLFVCFIQASFDSPLWSFGDRGMKSTKETHGLPAAWVVKLRCKLWKEKCAENKEVLNTKTNRGHACWQTLYLPPAVYVQTHMEDLGYLCLSRSQTYLIFLQN